MSRNAQLNLPPAEVKGSHRASDHSEAVVKKFHRGEEEPLQAAKEGMGAVIRDAIGPDKLEAYGHAGLVSGVCSGEKVPEYLANIYANEGARLRMAKSLLRSSGKQVRERTVFEIDERIA